MVVIVVFKGSGLRVEGKHLDSPKDSVSALKVDEVENIAVALMVLRHRGELYKLL